MSGIFRLTHFFLFGLNLLVIFCVSAFQFHVSIIGIVIIFIIEINLTQLFFLICLFLLRFSVNSGNFLVFCYLSGLDCIIENSQRISIMLCLVPGFIQPLELIVIERMNNSIILIRDNEILFGGNGQIIVSLTLECPNVDGVF